MNWLALIISMPLWVYFTAPFMIWQNISTGHVRTPKAAIVLGTTWYIRFDGGDRNQCTGKTDAAYPGSGTNQDCGFYDLRYMYVDGSYNASATYPGWGNVYAGGDTIIIESCALWSAPNVLQIPLTIDPNGCSIGMNGGGVSDEPVNYYKMGLWGTPSAGMYPIASGISSGQRTRILGSGFNPSTHSCSSYTKITGRHSAGNVIAVGSSSHIQIACLEITDRAQCNRGGISGTNPWACNAAVPYDDYSLNGIQMSAGNTDVVIEEVKIHGMAQAGIAGPTGDGFMLINFNISFNNAAGFNLDDGSGSTLTGSHTEHNGIYSWNGCTEEYPLVHTVPIPSGGCFSQNGPYGGYGDAWGTTSNVASVPGAVVNFSNITCYYNTQDCLDALHVSGIGSSITIQYSDAYGNMGQAFKIGGSPPILRNNFAIGNVNALRYAIPGTVTGYNTNLASSDFGRGGDATIAVTVSDSYTPIIQCNTVVAATSIAYMHTCAGEALPINTCNAPLEIYQNNVMLGFVNNSANGYPGGGSGSPTDRLWYDTSGIPQGIGVFGNAGSKLDHNGTQGEKQTCPLPGETVAICSGLGLVDMTWHLYGTANYSPNTGSVLFLAGTPIGGILTDTNGTTRNTTHPTIGAYEITY
jgi:hypothetical protein